MINEDKVKELFYVARYDSEEDRFQNRCHHITDGILYGKKY